MNRKTKIGFHASHEQLPPSALLEHVTQAESAGFEAAMCSDHFHPWLSREGQSGFAWSWLGAALQATKLSFGTVCAPGQRYHPAIIAQAAATLSEMFPRRFWLAIGSGEAVNESITGDPWPPKPERNERLKEAAEVIRALWAGETVNHRGHFTVRDAKLYTLPKRPPLLIAAAITAETAGWAGGWADGLITVGVQAEGLKKNIDAFREGGGESKPIMLQSALSFARTKEEALKAAHDQWGHAALTAPLIADLPTPQYFDAACANIPAEALLGRLRISADLEEHWRWIERDAELGVEAIYLHQVGRHALPDFIEKFGERIRAR
jgi:probable non-F420 flavinoid oxidoreductase